jgi:hypothetical protein
VFAAPSHGTHTDSEHGWSADANLAATLETTGRNTPSDLEVHGCEDALALEPMQGRPIFLSLFQVTRAKVK